MTVPPAAPPRPTPAVAAARQAPPRWFLDALAWIKSSGDDTAGRLSLVEFLIPAGSASPWHVHHTEDEAFYVLEGRLTVVVADRQVALGPGDFAFGPRGVPHGFRVEGAQPARGLLLTTGGDYAAFVHEVSEPATAPILPEPREPDLPRLVAAAARYGMDVLGPLPR
jgi:mannose-6-phosphate isomerase-like protein (cupin superfamily)